MRLLYTWAFILAVVLFSSTGDVLMAKAMTSTGDLDEIRSRHGLLGAAKAVVTSGWFMSGITALSFSFFSLLIALSWGDLSLVIPATASLTFVVSAVAAKFFLKEDVDRRRWTAVILVCLGVLLLNK